MKNMFSFSFYFLKCNLFISCILGLLLLAKHVFRNTLTPKARYRLWTMIELLFLFPFLPIRFSLLHGLTQIFQSTTLPTKVISTSETSATGSLTNIITTIEDYALASSQNSSDMIESVLFFIWVVGILILSIVLFLSWKKVQLIRNTSLPLQNNDLQSIYHSCANALGIKRTIPIYSCAYIQSPMVIGLIRPGIYLPLQLITSYDEITLRHLLLHELIHYKNRDQFSNYFLNLIVLLYWFNPLVWRAIRLMRNDREISCDTEVLHTIGEDNRIAYGNTLLNHAKHQLTQPVFSMTSGISSGKRQLRLRILSIRQYHTPTLTRQFRSHLVFFLLSVLILSMISVLPVYATPRSNYSWDTSNETITYVNLSESFHDYQGSFVLYDVTKEEWMVYNLADATKRISPASTYKPYMALFALDQNLITPTNSHLSWDGTKYPFQEWNRDHTLATALRSSVNWYFQTLDCKLGQKKIKEYLRQIGYGNENLGNSISEYWLDSSLLISPIEQVKLLSKFYQNQLDFSVDDINTVKNSLYLSTSDLGTLYGKTGTTKSKNHNVNGWFVGYLTTSSTTYVFATNIQNTDNATGTIACEITLSILDDLRL